MPHIMQEPAKPPNIALKSNAEAKIDVNLRDVAISYSAGETNIGNGDILLGDGRENQKSYPGVTVNTTAVDAEVQMQFPGMPSKTVKQTVQADTPSTLTQPAAAAIGSAKFSTLADAVAAAAGSGTKKTAAEMKALLEDGIK